MKRWLAEHVWLIFWLVCLSQAALWFWWIRFATEHRPQMIQPNKPAAVQPAEPAESPDELEVVQP